MSDRGNTPGDDCGCCAGVQARTPVGRHNPQGLSAVAYRVGSWDDFRQSLLARLSSTDHPALASLTTRHGDDWTLALADAFATMAEVLSFYQERIANESWLRTAAERRSVLELAQLVGYQLAPGVAATTRLAFTLDLPLVQPAPPPLPVAVPVGTRVQSVPADGETAQTFETLEAITARAEWNALPVQTAERELPWLGQRVLWLQGTATQLQRGDAILLVGTRREADPGSETWDLRWLDRVDVDNTRGLTRVSWTQPLGSFTPRVAPATDGVRVYAMRQRAALFGHNAIDPNQIDFTRMPPAQRDTLVVDSGGGVLAWRGFGIDTAQRRLDLDAVYPRLVIGGWVALAGGSGASVASGYVELYRISGVGQVSRAAYGLSGKLTRLTLDTDENLGRFDLRRAGVLAQSEELALAERPLLYPLFGDRLALASVQKLLVAGQSLALRGRRQRIVAPASPAGISFPGNAGRLALPGESFIVATPPVRVGEGGALLAVAPEDLDVGSAFTGTLRWTLIDRDSATVTLQAAAGLMQMEPAREDDPMVDDVATIASGADAIVHTTDRTALRLAAPLAVCFDRATVTVNANLALASHGEAVGELLGSGDASVPGQRFMLKQAPLTQVPAATPSGRVAALELRVDELLWQEVRTLFDQPPTARVYALRQADDGSTTLQFGDGIEGARLPSGSNNLRASYRKGLGLAGNVRAGTLTTLLSRPLGVKAARNPLPASGGDDPETLDTARRNAPLTVLTLDRAVSITDYADFARAYAGIAKATAVFIPGGSARGVHITVAGAGGAAVRPSGQTYRSLLSALREYGDALLPLTLQSYVAAGFVLTARVKVAADAVADDVLAACNAALRSAYGFDARDFGQAVTIDGVVAVLHAVAGVVAVDIDALHRSGSAPGAGPAPRIFPAPALIRPDGSVSAAELLTLDPLGLVLSLWT